MPDMFKMPAEQAVQRLAVLVPGGVATAERAMEAYGAARAGRGESVTPADTWFAVQTDRTFRIQSIRVAEAHASHSPAYMYLFSWPSPLMNGVLGACHGLELPFMFGNFEGPLGNLAGHSEEAQALSAVMRASWLAFARTGNPNHEGLPQWDAYDAGQRATMRFDRECALEHDPLPAERRFWDTV